MPAARSAAARASASPARELFCDRGWSLLEATPATTLAAKLAGMMVQMRSIFARQLPQSSPELDDRSTVQ